MDSVKIDVKSLMLKWGVILLYLATATTEYSNTKPTGAHM